METNNIEQKHKSEESDDKSILDGFEKVIKGLEKYPEQLETTVKAFIDYLRTRTDELLNSGKLNEAITLLSRAQKILAQREINAENILKNYYQKLREISIEELEKMGVAGLLKFLNENVKIENDERFTQLDASIIYKLTFKKLEIGNYQDIADDIIDSAIERLVAKPKPIRFYVLGGKKGGYQVISGKPNESIRKIIEKFNE